MKSRSLVLSITAIAVVGLAVWVATTFRSPAPRSSWPETTGGSDREVAAPAEGRAPTRAAEAQSPTATASPAPPPVPASPAPPFTRSVKPPTALAYAPSESGSKRPGTEDDSAANVFPWPPPAPSTTYQLPNSYFGATATMGAVAQTITRALESSGYVERRYYKLPVEGLALVTRLERVNEDGSPAAPRWLTSEGARPSLYLLVRGLFVTDPGHYRVIVFLITRELPGRKIEDVPIAQAKAWLEGGLDDVPADAGALPYANGRTIAYIYDFVSNGRTFVLDREPMPGKDQLAKAGVLAALSGTGR